jgi:hypothetical protein
MRAFLILIAINAISAIYINQAKPVHQDNKKALSRNRYDHFPARRSEHSKRNRHNRFRSYSDDSDKKSVSAKKNHSSKKSQKHNKRSGKDVKEKSLKDEDFFLYYEDKVNNVMYYYPKSAVPASKANAMEVEFLNSLGGLEGVVIIVGTLVNEHLLKNPKMKDECTLLGANLAKDLVDFFVRVALSDKYDLKGLKEAFGQSRLLKRINFNEFVIMVIRAAETVGIKNAYIQQLTDKLDIVRVGMSNQ